MTIARFAVAILPLLAMVFVSPPPARGSDGPPEWGYPIFRAGAFAVLMKDVVVKLEEEDMLAIAAYLATQAP